VGGGELVWEHALPCSPLIVELGKQ